MSRRELNVGECNSDGDVVISVVTGSGDSRWVDQLLLFRCEAVQLLQELEEIISEAPDGES